MSRSCRNGPEFSCSSSQAAPAGYARKAVFSENPALPRTGFHPSSRRGTACRSADGQTSSCRDSFYMRTCGAGHAYDTSLCNSLIVAEQDVPSPGRPHATTQASPLTVNCRLASMAGGRPAVKPGAGEPFPSWCRLCDAPYPDLLMPRFPASRPSSAPSARPPRRSTATPRPSAPGKSPAAAPASSTGPEARSPVGAPVPGTEAALAVRLIEVDDESGGQRPVSYTHLRAHET